MSSINSTGRLGVRTPTTSSIEGNAEPAGVKMFSRERKEEPASVDGMFRNPGLRSPNRSRLVASHYPQAANPNANLNLNPNPNANLHPNANLGVVVHNPSPNLLAVPTGALPALLRTPGTGNLQGAGGIAAYAHRLRAINPNAAAVMPQNVAALSQDPPSYQEAMRDQPPPYHQAVRALTPPPHQQ